MLLMIDNYDSFTYNLVQYFGELGVEVQVVRNDAITLPEIARLKPKRLIVWDLKREYSAAKLHTSDLAEAIRKPLGGISVVVDNAAGAGGTGCPLINWRMA